jgi:hypothetical protein
MESPGIPNSYEASPGIPKQNRGYIGNVEGIRFFFEKREDEYGRVPSNTNMDFEFHRK